MSSASRDSDPWPRALPRISVGASPLHLASLAEGLWIRPCLPLSKLSNKRCFFDNLPSYLVKEMEKAHHDISLMSRISSFLQCVSVSVDCKSMWKVGLCLTTRLYMYMYASADALARSPCSLNFPGFLDPTILVGIWSDSRALSGADIIGALLRIG